MTILNPNIIKPNIPLNGQSRQKEKIWDLKFLEFKMVHYKTSAVITSKDISDAKFPVL